jgi:DNA-directed RNA polymerase specialized sigma54-like protein
LLGVQGLAIARRTIAKYREALHIPPSHLRHKTA